MRRSVWVALLFLLSMITDIDRVSMAAAQGPVAAELALSVTAMGAALRAFALDYALAQIPGGWLAALLHGVAIACWCKIASLAPEHPS